MRSLFRKDLPFSTCVVWKDPEEEGMRSFVVKNQKVSEDGLRGKNTKDYPRVIYDDSTLWKKAQRRRMVKPRNRRQ